VEDGRGALTRPPALCGAARPKFTRHFTPGLCRTRARRARARVSLMAGAARRTVLVASAWTILDAEDNPCAVSADAGRCHLRDYGCEFM
jgi:hypothetical protein